MKDKLPNKSCYTLKPVLFSYKNWNSDLHRSWHKILDISFNPISLLGVVITMYRVTHKEWDCKDDQKLLKYDDLKLDFWFLHSIEFFDGLACKEPWIQGNGLNKLRTSVSEVYLCCMGGGVKFCAVYI